MQKARTVGFDLTGCYNQTVLKFAIQMFHLKAYLQNVGLFSSYSSYQPPLSWTVPLKKKKENHIAKTTETHECKRFQATPKQKVIVVKSDVFMIFLHNRTPVIK